MTAETLIKNAEGLRELVRDSAHEAERLGHYTTEVHQAFLDAGLYHMLTPRKYGGHEVDLKTFAKVLIEIGRGDPGTAWCLSLGHGNTQSTVATWSAQTQDEIFNNERGYFRASHSLNPAGSAQRVEGGWLINARSRYNSGVPYATHATVAVQVVEEGQAPDPDAPVSPLTQLQVLIPEGQFTIQDDWGGDAVLGMRASGSNTVVVDNVVVPEHYGVFLGADFATSPGVQLHGNPMYLGSPGVFPLLEVVLPVIGAARAALDEYEHLARTKKAATLGGGSRLEDPFYQRDYGLATMKADSAEAIVMHILGTYADFCRDVVDGVRPFSFETETALASTLLQAAELAGETVDILWRSAGSSAAARGQRMQRYLRDVSMFRTHYAAQLNSNARMFGAMLLGASAMPF
ncbi:3-hydroxy-9,10-secoandrosta-1,3,5(10)-triene-9,17-dione monooxygenase [Nonomuraea solani]|uniref:3-hydroxy-9,10-secoandrosta-1,3,5(10)-triene-9,17-dione monooxygenase n=1 Tax=Nonomuraea solani TaxID=1144553 RepID=A0A1H6CRY3_9ACTN|nr:acyl-CoA dehydrogenase family protein [Nonomuraea solani]SEG75413.1 3-hydroxy-9,10-secoandrosta-1,3,5(10)-triene-9,17-dione monooxygenase [Nonomuraea solani]